MRYRFGVARLPSLLPQLRSTVQRYESQGFEFVAVGDHVGGESPFALLTAAAATTERLRLRTYVLNASFWNPVLLAREAATLDRLSAGRLELGLGAGTVRAEFRTASIRWQPAPTRIERMKATLITVRDLLAGDHEPAPIQKPIPLMVGAMSHRGLAVAAEHANVIAFGAIRHKPGHPPGTLTAASAEQTDELVAAARRAAGARSFESDVLLQAVQLGKDPLAAAKAYLQREGERDDPQILAESPCVLFARTAADAAAELERRRRRWGFTSITTFAPFSDAMASIIQELR